MIDRKGASIETTDVWRLYERHAADYDRDRGRRLMEWAYLTEVIDRLPVGARILDLGCGMGEPIARFFIERGHCVTGIDAAPAMIALCEKRFPGCEWIVADMRGLELGRRFDAIIAWDSFFHLDHDAQRAMFKVFARHAAKAALLLFTSGHNEGVALGELYGEELYHASLDADEYRALIGNWGFSVLRHRTQDPDCGQHTVWLAQAV